MATAYWPGADDGGFTSVITDRVVFVAGQFQLTKSVSFHGIANAHLSRTYYSYLPLSLDDVGISDVD